jgi:hypothetical protein
MNGLVSFRLCKLSTPELLKKVDKLTDEMYQKCEVPARNIPARPDDDYDLLIGELILRVQEMSKILTDFESIIKKSSIGFEPVITGWRETVTEYGTLHTPTFEKPPMMGMSY